MVEPYVESWTLGVEHSFGKSYTLEVRYLGSKSNHLQTEEYLNIQPVVTPTNFLPTYIGNVPSAAVLATMPTLSQIEANRPSFVPAWTAAGFGSTLLQGWRPWASAKYDGLATQFTRRMTNGLQLQAAWTWSNSRDDVETDQISSNLTPRRAQNSQDIAAEWGPSALDHRHRVTVEAIYDLPFFRDKSYVMKNLVGNWEVVPIYTFESPEYATVQSNLNSNLDGDSVGQRAILNPAGAPGTSSDVTALTNGTKCPASGSTTPATCAQNIVGYSANNPNAEYIRAQLGALMNIGKNTLPMPHINNWDMNIVKRLSITESKAFEFHLEAYNFFNHPQWVPGSIRSINAVSSSSSTVLNLLTPGNAVFDKPQLIFSSNPRTLQLVLKFLF